MTVEPSSDADGEETLNRRRFLAGAASLGAAAATPASWGRPPASPSLSRTRRRPWRYRTRRRRRERRLRRPVRAGVGVRPRGLTAGRQKLRVRRESGGPDRLRRGGDRHRERGEPVGARHDVRRHGGDQRPGGETVRRQRAVGLFRRLRDAPTRRSGEQ
ncbi:twin-arginine translocation signal domain-containing protein [Halogeometricum sp. CBA1124]|nr:twin-arginine translocation signal domain-containing protein [Halogeometricum sp. CBA1124]